MSFSIFVNFKTYHAGMAENAIALSDVCFSVEEETDVDIVAVVGAVDISACSGVHRGIYAQHVDYIEKESSTGGVYAGAVAHAGAMGTILNHSEKRIAPSIIEKSIRQAQENGLEVVLCVESIDELKKYKEYKPHMIAIEPPDLIGGDVSVTTRPDLIAEAVKIAGDMPLLVGAGVKTPEDIRIAKELGASGVLLASGVVKAENPREVLMGLALAAK